MGTPIPNEEFYIDPLKTYNLCLYTWNWFPGPPRCGGLQMADANCQKTGAEIIAWLDGGFECSDTPLCAPPLLPYGQKIKSIEEV